MKKLVVLLTLSNILMGCASHPDEIPTQYVSSVSYKDYDCDQIGLEMTRISSRVNQLQTSLEEKADNDSAQMAVGMVLFWPTLFFLEGGDGPEAQEYGRLKGEFDALQQLNIQKKCNLPQAGQMVAAPTPVQPAVVAAPATTTTPVQAFTASPVQPVATSANVPLQPQAATEPMPVYQPVATTALPVAPPPTLQTAVPPAPSRASALSNALGQQILPCWQPPPEAQTGKAEVVGINLRLLPDGTVESATALDGSRMQIDPAYRALAESAQQAAFKCSPLNLPRDEYDSWKNINMNFRHVGT